MPLVTLNFHFSWFIRTSSACRCLETQLLLSLDDATVAYAWTSSWSKYDAYLVGYALIFRLSLIHI